MDRQCESLPGLRAYDSIELSDAGLPINGRQVDPELLLKSLLKPEAGIVYAMKNPGVE